MPRGRTGVPAALERRALRTPMRLHVAVAGPALAIAALEYPVLRLHLAGREGGLVRQRGVDRGEVRRGGLHQLFEAVDDEVGLLEGVDAVAGAHDPRQVEADAVGRGRFQR